MTTPERGAGSPGYDAFITSDVWKAIRRKAFAFYGKTCQACKESPRSLDVHHATYTRFGGRERMTDLRILCRGCHEALHDLHKRNGGSLRVTTDAFIGGCESKPRRTKRKRKRKTAAGLAAEGAELQASKGRPTPKVPDPVMRQCSACGSPRPKGKPCTRTGCVKAARAASRESTCGCTLSESGVPVICPRHVHAIRRAVARARNGGRPGVGPEPRLTPNRTPDYLNGGAPMT